MKGLLTEYCSKVVNEGSPTLTMSPLLSFSRSIQQTHSRTACFYKRQGQIHVTIYYTCKFPQGGTITFLLLLFFFYMGLLFRYFNLALAFNGSSLLRTCVLIQRTDSKANTIMLPVRLERWPLTGWWSNRAARGAPLCTHRLCSGSVTIVNATITQTQKQLNVQKHNVTDDGLHEGRPTVWMMSEAAAVDVVSGQTTDGWYERGKSLPIELSDISLKRNKKKKNTDAHLSRRRQGWQRANTKGNFVPRFTSMVVNGTTTASVSTSLTWMQNLSEMWTLDMDPFCHFYRNRPFM